MLTNNIVGANTNLVCCHLLIYTNTMKIPHKEVSSKKIVLSKKVSYRK
jgi:hypothetical protein